MDYLVIGQDGQEYGPANEETLKAWVADNRIGADTNLREFQSGRVLPAGSIPDLFPPKAPPQLQNPYQNPPSPYPRNLPPGAMRVVNGNWDVFWAFFRSAIALVLFFFLKGLGVIVGIYSLIYAIRAYQSGHKLGLVAVIVSVITLIILGIGWFLRLNGAGV